MHAFPLAHCSFQTIKILNNPTPSRTVVEQEFHPCSFYPPFWTSSTTIRHSNRDEQQCESVLLLQNVIHFLCESVILSQKPSTTGSQARLIYLCGAWLLMVFSNHKLLKLQMQKYSKPSQFHSFGWNNEGSMSDEGWGLVIGLCLPQPPPPAVP